MGVDAEEELNTNVEERESAVQAGCSPKQPTAAGCFFTLTPLEKQDNKGLLRERWLRVSEPRFPI